MPRRRRSLARGLITCVPYICARELVANLASNKTNIINVFNARGEAVCSQSITIYLYIYCK